MSLRCRKGDLAMLLRGFCSGRFVTVKKFVGMASAESFETGKLEWCQDLWEVEVPWLSLPAGVERVVASDKDLLPIRPGDLRETEEAKKEIIV